MSGLNDRIAAAVAGDQLTSGEIANLIAEAGQAVEANKADHVRAEKEALDPRLSGENVERARAEMSDLAFAGRRLAAGIEALKPVLASARAREEEAGRRADYAKAKERRDAAAERLRDRYPVLAAEIAEILQEVQEAGRDVENANCRLPRGAAVLLTPEFEVRGVSPNGQHAAGQVWPLAQTVALPALSGRDAAYGLNIWDRSRA